LVRGTWYRQEAAENQTILGLGMGQHKTRLRFVICVQNEGCEDLEVGKVYQVLADESAAQDGYIRVVDESGEDYLYPADLFVPIALPRAAEQALFSLATTDARAVVAGA